jgi:hypothetical protein
MPWYHPDSYLPKRKDALAALGSMVQIVGGLVAAGALVVAVCQFSIANRQLATATQQLQLARQALQSSTVWQAQREGRDLLGAIQASGSAPCIFDPERWSAPGCITPEAVRKRDAQLVRLVQFYASVYRQHDAFGPEAWEAFRLEICQQLRENRPIQIFWQDTVQGGAYAGEFKDLPKSCGVK